MAEIIEKTGKSYNIFDKVNNVWNKISFWHKASDCEFNDGKTAQTKVGAIDGITSDLSGESETVAASIKCVNQLNSSLSENTAFPDYTNIVKSGAITDWVATEDIYFESLYCEYYGSTISTDYRVKVNNTYVGAKNSASISQSKLYISTSHGYAKKGDVISCKTSTFVAYGLKK